MVQILSMPDTTNKPNVPDNSIDYNDLGRLGLSRTAIACYAALAENGPGTAGELAKRLGRPRTSVYHALNKLLIWGLRRKFKINRIASGYPFSCRPAG